LHSLYQPGTNAFDSVLRFPLAQTQSEVANHTIVVQFFHGRAEIRFGSEDGKWILRYWLQQYVFLSFILPDILSRNNELRQTIQPFP